MSTSRKSRVSIADIAKLAKVSNAAVSYAMNGNGRLDASTRARILKVADELGYTANFQARRLRRKQSGVIVVSMSVPQEVFRMARDMHYFMAIWQGAMEVALANGYLLLLAPGNSDPGLIDHTDYDAGLIIDPQADNDLIDHFITRDARVVTIGEVPGQVSSGDIGMVNSPHAELGREAFDLLWARGARRIALILGSRTYGYNDEIYRIYQEFVAQKNIPPLVYDVGMVTSETAGYNAMESLLADGLDIPDAVFAGLDRLACGALLAAQRASLSVPQDLMIVSGSDGITGRADIPITSLDHFPHKLGRKAIQMLINRLDLNQPMKNTTVPGTLRLRASTDRHERK